MPKIEDQGPSYPDMGSAVAKYRKIPKDQLTVEQRDAYSAAIVAKIKSLQRSVVMRDTPSHKCDCASGTAFNRGEDIHRAIREQQERALLAYPAKARKARTNYEWWDMYEKAMKAKREMG
jgi:hypothetical protein